MTDIDFKEKTKTLIDSLKSISANMAWATMATSLK
jgi:hypothetical protein